MSDLIFEPETGAFLRLVLESPIDVRLMPIGQVGKWVFRRSFKYYQSMLDDGLWKKVPPETLLEDSNGIIWIHRGTALSQEHGENLHKRLSAAFSDVGRLLTRKSRADLYRALRETDKKLSKETFYRAVRRWLEGG